MVRVIFCGYRKWAIDVFEHFKNSSNVSIVDVFNTRQDFSEKLALYTPEQIDVIVFCGWSWIVDKEILDKYLCVGIHPSDLPEYRGGSPLQHQIMDGLEYTNITLMSLSDEGIDAGDIWDKEPMSLKGDSMQIVFRSLSESSKKLLDRFFTDFGTKEPYAQDLSKGNCYFRRKPEESEITRKMLQEYTARQLYDFIRMLTDPYPNAYICDENGNKLVIKAVEFIEAGCNV